MNNLTVISGGSKGIGADLIQSLIEKGPVLNISRTPAELKQSTSIHELHNICVDLANTNELEARLNSWFELHKDFTVDLVICNAANLTLKWLVDVNPNDFKNAFAVNVQAPICIVSSIQRMNAYSKDGARVIYVSSSLSRNLDSLTFAGLGLYSATKAALNRIARVQHREFSLRQLKIAATQVHPGIVDTNMQAELRSNVDIDPNFSAKTAGLPPYQEGDWSQTSPADQMRTIPTWLSSDFLLWVSKIPLEKLEAEYDFYKCDEFHQLRS